MSNQPKKNNKKTPAKKAPAKKAPAKKAAAKKVPAKKAPAKKSAPNGPVPNKKAPTKQKTSATPKQEEVITITIDPIIEAEERTELVKAISAPEKPKGLKSKVKSLFRKK